MGKKLVPTTLQLQKEEITTITRVFETLKSHLSQFAEQPCRFTKLTHCGIVEDIKPNGSILFKFYTF